MITKYEKANKGKLLVAVLALFVVLAGAAVVFSDSDVNATTPAAVEVTNISDDVDQGVYTLSSTPAKALYVTDDVTIDVDAASLSATLYLKPDVTVSFTGENITISAYVVDSTGLSADGKVTPIGNDSTALSLTSITATSTTKIDSGINFLRTNASGTPAGAGITLTETDSYKTYYVAGATNVQITLGESESVIITNGTATVEQDTNSANIKITSGSGITVAAGTEGTKGGYPTISGTLTTDGNYVTVSSGFFNSAAADSLTVNPSGTINAVLLKTNGNEYYYTNQITTTIADVTKTGEGAVTVDEATVYGDVTQKSSVGNKDSLTSGITLKGAGTLTINNNVNVYVKTMTAENYTGSVNLYGALYAGTGSTYALKGTIGPNGYYKGLTGTIDATNFTNTNVAPGVKNYAISGVPSSDSVGDAILEGELIIPEGKTFTVTGNLGLNGFEITVQGTLIIDNRASISGTGDANEAIVIEGKGTIQNNGTIGKMIGVKVSYTKDTTEQSITMQGVSGVSFAIDRTYGMVVSGDITATSGAETSKLTITNALISGDFTTAKKVILDVGSAGVTVAKNSTVVLNGNVAGSGAIKLSEGASVSVNGSFTSTATITSDVGQIDAANNTLIADKTDTVTIDPASDETGFTMYVKKVAVASDDGATTEYYLRAYVNGTLSVIKDATEDTNATTIGGTEDYNIYVAADETLTIGEDVKATVSNVTVEGTIIITPDANEDSAVNNYIGATYTVETTGSNNQPIYTYYYTTLAAAMDAIETANDEGVTAYVDDLDINVTVADGQLVNLNVAGTISQNAVLTVENGGTLEGEIAKVDGKMVIQPDADSVTPGQYDVVSTSEDGTVTYAGIAVAIAEAQPGDKITVESADIDGSLTIPQGVEVTVNNTLAINGNLTVAAEATLTGGAITMQKDKSTVTVNGTLDLSEGSITAASGVTFTLTSAGTTIVQDTDGLTYNGARYTNDDGDTVITTVANAVAYAVENEITTPVYVHGKVTETADLTLDGVDIQLDSAAEVTLGNVTLSDAKITSTGAQLTATVSGMNGEGDAAVSGAVSVNKSALVLNATEVVNAAGTTVYTYTISAISGTMAVQSGTVVINTTFNTDAGSKFTVATGATLLVADNGALTVQGEKTEFTVDGTLDVDEGTVTFTSGTSVINGTASIHGGSDAAINAAALVINGTVNVSATENDDGTFNITANGVAVGDVKEALGSTGSIVGVVNFTENGTYITAYAGTDMSGAKLADGAEFETTAYYVNDALYATVYAATTGVGSPITATMITEIPGIADETNKITVADSEGNEIKDAFTVGQYDAVYITAPLDKVSITVSAGSQISLYIDGVKYSSGAEVSLTIGTHTVEATVNPGYTGDVTISFNGQAVTNGTIEITAGTEAGTVLSAIGNITIDGASTGSSDGGMGIVEILLVILVVVVVILAIIVVLRMMRS